MSETKLTQGEIPTKKGVMKFELYDDATPIAVENFKKLIKQRGSPNHLPSGISKSHARVVAAGWLQRIPCDFER